MSVNLQPRSESSWRVEALGITKFSKAMGANIYRPSKPTYFTSLRNAASLAAAPASRAAAEMYESANGQMTVTSQQSALPFCQGTRESPSGHFPSERDKPVGSLKMGTPAAEKLQAIKSFREWFLIVLPGAFLQTKLWRPRASTVEPQRHSCGEHKSSPSLRLPHHLTASRTRQLGGRTANHCYAVCKQLRKRHGYALLIWITYYYYYYLVPLVV